jgi:hypothetical protein
METSREGVSDIDRLAERDGRLKMTLGVALYLPKW